MNAVCRRRALASTEQERVEFEPRDTVRGPNIRLP